MDMSNPFEDLETYLANALNLDADIAGILLGMALTIPLAIMLIWTLDPKGKDQSGNIFVIAFGLGIGISTAVGWFPIYIPIIVGLLFAFVVIDPFGSKRGR